MTELNAENAEYFYYNGAALWPCLIVANAVNHSETIGVVIKCHFYKLPFMVASSVVFARNDPRLEISNGRADYHVVFKKVEDNEEE